MKVTQASNDIFLCLEEKIFFEANIMNALSEVDKLKYNRKKNFWG